MITLTHVVGTRLYQGENSAEPGFLTYFVSDDQVPTSELPPLLTIDRAWSDATLRGYFLFLNKEPEGILIFAEAVSEHGFPTPQHASFAWVEFDQDPLVFDVKSQVDLKPDASEENVVVAVGTTVGFGNYAMPFMQDGVVLAINNQSDGINEFRFQYPIAYPPDRPPELPPDLPTPESAGVNVLLLGPQRYALRSLALVGDFSNATNQGFDVGLRYFYSQNGKVLSQYYPIFAAPSGYQVEFEVNWDPLAPLNPARSWMKFTGNAYLITITGAGQGKIEVIAESNILPTWLRTIYGEPLWLRPVLEGPHAARLVLQPMPSETPGAIAYYMVPDGDYEVLADPEADTSKQQYLLCGLAGTESIGFFPGTRQAPATTIRFHSWKPAFAPVFPLTDASDGIEASGANRPSALAQSALLDDTWPTAWISVAPSGVVANTDATYYAQPEQAALYEAKENAPPNMLELFQASVASFDPAALDDSYPLAIYAGLADAGAVAGFPTTELRKFEVQIINRFRKETISGDAAVRRAAAATTARGNEPAPLFTTTTTPQGLVAQVETKGTEWKSVLLAENHEDGSKLEFTNLSNELREALQSNQLFLVASRSGSLGDFQHEITLAGWPFDIDVGKDNQPGDYHNVLVFKFGRGSIKDLVTDPKLWTGANFFNDDASLISLFLQNYISNAETSAEDNHRFEKFVNLVSNPAWEGILALRVTVKLSEFPEDLKGLLAGIDLSRFVAHHFGIETSFVKSNGALEQTKSSLFGLISYVDRDYTARQQTRLFNRHVQLVAHVSPVVQALDPQTEFYDFKVLQLEIVFENSELLDFTSKIQLTTTRWFGETATLQSGYPPDPIDNQSIDLNGSYEVHNGQRSYSFYTDPAETYKFLIDSHVLNYVQIVKARFETLRTDPQPDLSEEIFTRFSFWGYLNFKEQSGFDLFSFGSQTNPQLSEKQGLYFSNLGLTMDFTLLPNNTTSSRTFAFDAGAASYDISQSEARNNSLFNRFPMKLTSIMQSDGRGSPADLGFLTVRTPKDFKALRLSEEWYALALELNLGSMGALAERAGFSAGLLLAWSPSEATVRAETLIKLPGTGGGKKLLSLQGVLKLSIQYFEFIAKPIAETEDLQYQLLFKNAGLSLLGVKMPSSGTIDMLLAGDPFRQLEAGSLSWIAAYIEKKSSSSSRLIKS